MWLKIVGQPVAWCITNYETTDVLELFLSHIKARSPAAMVSVLMSDDGNFMTLIVHEMLKNMYM